ncbi:MAG: hypothetical protein R6V04_07975 [bacterium]
MKKNSDIPFLCIIILFCFIVTHYSYSQQKRIQAWSTPETIQQYSFFEKAMLDTIFPAPELLPEPEYSLNNINTIKWDNDSIQTSLEKLKASLILYEVQAVYNNIELWGFVDSNVDSATFMNLPAGVPIEYRLRYIGIDSTGQNGLSYWSEPEISIQDKNPPVIHKLHIADLQQGDNTNWVLGNTLHFFIIASDSILGKVEKIYIRESNDINSQADTTIINIEPPEIYINREFTYHLLASEQEQLHLDFWISDLAGRKSYKREFTLFWISSSSEMFCFPNPFNPKKGEKSIIKIENKDVEEVRIYDLFGNLVRKLKRTWGNYFFEWDGLNGENEMVSSGGYICIVPGSSDLYCKIAVVR